MTVLGIAVEYTSIRAMRQTAASSCSTTSQARLRPPVRLEIFQDAEAHLAGATNYNANSVHSPIGRLPPDELFGHRERNKSGGGAT